MENKRILLDSSDLFYNQQDEKDKISYKLIDENTSDDDILLMINNIVNSPIISVDTETTGLNPFLNKVRLIQIGIEEPIKEIYIIDCFKVRNINDLVKTIFSNENTIKILHNGKFDYKMIKMSFGCEINGIIFDTMIASRLIDFNGFPNHRLDTLYRHFLNTIISKKLQNSDWSGIIYPEQYEYAARDVELLHDLRKILKDILIKKDIRKVTKIEFDYIKSLSVMELNGIKIDLNIWDKFIINVKEKINEITKSINNIIPGININNNQQLIKSIKNKFPELIKNKTNKLNEFSKYKNELLSLINYFYLYKDIVNYDLNINDLIINDILHIDYFQIGNNNGEQTSRNFNINNIINNLLYYNLNSKCFMPKENNNFLILNFDNIKPRILSMISKDRKLKEDLIIGEYGSSFERDLIINNDLLSMRSNEIVNYLYNKYLINLDVNKIDKIKNDYIYKYKDVSYWMYDTKEYVKKSRMLKTISGRTMKFRYNLSPIDMYDYRFRDEYSFIINSIKIDIIKKSINDINNYFNNNNIKIVNIINNSILIEYNKNIDINKYIKNINDIISKVGDEILVTVPLKVNYNICKNI